MILQETLKQLPAHRPVAILMRHAERDPIHSVDDSLAARLNQAGKAAAHQLGQNLVDFSPLRIYHSPVPRCLQTAEAVAAGVQAAGRSADIGGQMMELGGPYMKDWKTVMGRVLKEGAKPFVRDWFTGKLPEGLVQEAGEAAREQVRILANQLSEAQNTACILNVTHDWNIMLVRHAYFKPDQAAEAWPDYLEGIAAYHHQGKLYLQFIDKTAELCLNTINMGG